MLRPGRRLESRLGVSPGIGESVVVDLENRPASQQIASQILRRGGEGDPERQLRVIEAIRQAQRRGQAREAPGGSLDAPQATRDAAAERRNPQAVTISVTHRLVRQTAQTAEDERVDVPLFEAGRGIACQLAGET